MTELTVRVFPDGDCFCALIGSDLMEGIGGFGESPAAALEDLAIEVRNSGYSLSELARA